MNQHTKIIWKNISEYLLCMLFKYSANQKQDIILKYVIFFYNQLYLKEINIVLFDKCTFLHGTKKTMHL